MAEVSGKSGSQLASTAASDVDRLCVNSIRVLAIDAIEKANSGHPGLPMGMASAAYVLWTRCLRHNPHNPNWCGRDRFVLSAGHGSMLLYALLYLSGYALTLDDIKQFRQLGSRTPGHPENYLTSGVETTTGPLGQGFANGIGMAIAAKHLEAKFERHASGLFAHRIFGFVSDGDLMEGISSEAASLAGHLRLGNVVYLYDDNRITIEGSTQLAFSEDVCRRFEAYGWHTETVQDGNDLNAIERSLREACAVTERPSLIRLRTHIGYGSPHRHDTAKAHGQPLGQEEVKLTKQFYGWPLEPPFFVPEAALNEFRRCADRGNVLEREWNADFERYAQEYPSEARAFRAMLEGELPRDWDAELPSFSSRDTLATRRSAAMAENSIAAKVWNLFGGSGDLAESTFTEVEEGGDFERGNYLGRNLHFGIREHGMCGILNGIALHGGFIPYGSSFLVFTDYCRASIRLACLMRLHVIFIFTHDSIGLGEDGPTHQPVEHLTALRAMPHLTVIRPADANEAVEAWRVAMLRKQGPVMLVLSRQNIPTFDRVEMAPANGLSRGAYVLTETKRKDPSIILIGTGSEVQLAVAAKLELEKKGFAVRVVSMPSFELFQEQERAYQESVLPSSVNKRLAIEAGSSLCWHRWVGPAGDVIGMDDFGASGPARQLFEYFGFTTENVVTRALRLLAGPVEPRANLH
ncbi:MAG: transketolase [Candidatus Binataceae bacterium]